MRQAFQRALKLALDGEAGCWWGTETYPVNVIWCILAYEHELACNLFVRLMDSMERRKEAGTQIGEFQVSPNRMISWHMKVWPNGLLRAPFDISLWAKSSPFYGQWEVFGCVEILTRNHVCLSRGRQGPERSEDEDQACLFFLVMCCLLLWRFRHRRKTFKD